MNIIPEFAGAIDPNPFIQAVERGDFETVQANVLYGELTPDDITTALDKAAKTDHHAVIRVLFDHNTSMINKKLYHNIFLAVAKGDVAKSVEEERVDLAWDRIVTPIANADKSSKKRHFKALLSAIKGVMLNAPTLKTEEKLKKFIEVGLNKITALKPGKRIRADLETVTKLFVTRVGSEKQVAKVAKSLDPLERVELAGTLAIATDWADKEEAKAEVKAQIDILTKRKGEKKIGRKLKKAMNQIDEIRKYNAEAPIHAPAPHRELRVSKITKMKKIKEIMTKVKKWERQAQTSFTLAQAVAAKVPEERLDKLEDSNLIIGYIAKCLRKTKKRDIKKDRLECFVAKDPEKRVQAIAIVSPLPRDNAICLDYLATNPDNLQIVKAAKHPVSGAGTTLIQRVAKQAIKKGRSSVLITTTETAENWYISKFGFRRIYPPYDFRDLEVEEGEHVLQLDGEALRRAAS